MLARRRVDTGCVDGDADLADDDPAPRARRLAGNHLGSGLDGYLDLDCDGNADRSGINRRRRRFALRYTAFRHRRQVPLE
jgi:hypothetical protein